ncbi:MAG TPA: hypothetical protein VKY85_12405 [Candidatus Angelobacter sp.]|nr:hypothetical protein [Candidatus Angelobacter sp.]
MTRTIYLCLITLGMLAGIGASGGTVSGKIQVPQTASATGDSSDNGQENVVIWLEGREVPKAPDAVLQILQKNLQFSPDFLVATKGQKVELPNDDDVAHNVYSFTGANRFNLGIYPRGESRSITLGESGIVDLFCSMHARIFVVPSVYFVSRHPGQSFSINDVPAGKYTLKAWNERSHMFVRTIIVPQKGGVVENISLENGLSVTAKE